MTTKGGVNKAIITLIFLFSISFGFGQYIKNGKITFERKTNLMKRFEGIDRIRKMITEENKIKIDKFELLFDESASVFRPIRDVSEGKMGWMTTKNTYYQNFTDESQFTILALFGQNVYIKDSLPERQWKITDSKRNIGGYKCRKAMYEKNDSTRIYAWYTPEITINTGPEGYCGLPGTILGLATEDGGIVYFAKKIELMDPKKEDLVPESTKKQVFTLKELKIKIEKDYGNTPWGKGMFEDLFRWL